MDVSVVEPLFAEKQVCQVVIIPKQEIKPVGRGCDPDGCLVVADGLLRLALGTTYTAKEVVTVTDRKLITCVREETNHL